MADRYDQDIVKARRRSRSTAEDAPMEDLYNKTQINDDFGKTSASATSSNGSSAEAKKGGAAAGQAMAGGASGTDAVAGGLMMSGNPYAMAAGAGLAVLSASDKRKQQMKEMERREAFQARQARVERQQQAISKLIGITDSMRQL